MTSSSNFPTTPGAYDRTYTSSGMSADIFLVKLNQTGTGPIYSTYLGSWSADVITGVEIDAGGNATLVGYTESENFPTTQGA